MPENIPASKQMNNTAICLKFVHELLGNDFLIPAYQRGYRWREQQVRELLEDVLAFQASEDHGGRKGFYCLQPVVVKAVERDAAWEVVDGQQRLTTLFLVLQYFNRRLAEGFQRKIYKIRFETRPASEAYLAAPTEERAEDNIDFHFIYIAKTTIEQWFKDKDHLVNDFEAALLNRVAIIWYELPETDSAVDAFTRLNIGKIPLTNAELVRALFLRSKLAEQGRPSLEQLKIAQEWDAMEKALQNDEFWYFFTDETTQRSPNRIEFLFDLIAAADMTTTWGTYTSFHYFNDRLSRKNIDAEHLWDKVKQYFSTLEEWYRDHKLFHLIGYWINEGGDLLQLIQRSESMAKAAFRDLLKHLILSELAPDLADDNYGRERLRASLAEFLGGLEYGIHSSRIKSVLLLFNIASIIANVRSVVRFRFDFFKKENWDIEHIRSVASGQPSSNSYKRAWLESVRDYFVETDDENHSLRSQVREMLDLKTYTTGDAFDVLYHDIVVHFREDETLEGANGLGNLALLDSGTNRGYGNAVFPIKRRRLLKYDQEGTFVPLCTRNAFLKCYSGDVQNMLFWGYEDQRDYRDAIVNTLADFFCN